ncbi:hypothetical protein N7468_007285 [Penicillium chermesinum]|uniref:N-acetyltransferase domain-containing protein n=1 Tax=Penicillium chermesinum TaxID=63820 RepID=A0A9W9NU26_9EURO|nr:uncharacterized protein N7468_007285 [Penicillium chermesinum]KAJ5226060.1 hypothetical protein N7468_007285 [Penicillium chermesinum]
MGDSDVQFRLVTKLEDIRPLTFIAAESWADDSIFAWIVPGRFRRPDHYLKLWYYILKTEFFTPGRHILIAERHGVAGPTVLGFAVWEPPAASPYREPLNRKKRLASRIRHLSIKCQISCLLIFTNFSKTCLLPKVHELEQERETRKTRDPPPDEKWYLHFLGVSPRFQRQGIGRQLLHWGIDKADEEKMPCFLEASERGRPLYESAGFITYDWQVLNGGEIKNSVMKREPQLLT